MIAEMELKVIKADVNDVLLKMPFNKDFCADAAGELLHGGILTALMDSAFGLANFLAVPKLQATATLDLRVEYLRPAKSQADVMVFAECYRQSRHIVFNRGSVWFDGDKENEIAVGYATFALTRKSEMDKNIRQESNQ